MTGRGRLPTGEGLDVHTRLRAIAMINNELAAHVPESYKLSREIEAVAHAASTNKRRYIDAIRRCCRNCYNNPTNATPYMAIVDDSQLLHGTIIERIRAFEAQQRRNFCKMLQEKWDSITDGGEFKSTLTCRRCGSNDISWETKQTRSSDEATTAFCVCAECQHHWTMN